MICFVGLSVGFLLVGRTTAQPLIGFDEKSAVAQQELESRFDTHLSADSLRTWMKFMSARPHHVGSPYGKEVADFIEAKFKTWRFDTKIETYHVLLPTPKTRILEMVAPTRFTARLQEAALPEDATSSQTDMLPPYNAYSADGDVTGEVVYVNQGLPQDYEELDRRGIDVRGKIVLARYGDSWRGIKPKLAHEKGAIACIIYSDPRDGGYFSGDVYPKGPWKNNSGVQRGSVFDLPRRPGDPLTPGIGARKNAKRIKREDAETLLEIPVLPISADDALPILSALEGHVAPANWRGSLPITYHTGPGPAEIHLKLEFNWDIVPAHNVIARMKGSEHPDQWVIRGNHHDAWVHGAADPISGLNAVLAEARSIGELAKGGWRPKRTLIYCAWDGEEQGLLGSTEWVEDHAKELNEKAVAYINTDGNSRGFLRVGGSHTLERLVNEVARDVIDPQTGVSVLERRQARAIVRGDKEAKRDAFHIGALGSGSDYSPFIQHAGIAALSLGYGGEGSGGSYHTAYDSFDHYTRFRDPTLEYGVTLAKTAGRLVLRLANADRLPFEFNTFVETVEGYVEDVVKLADDLREETEDLNERVDDGLYQLALDPTKGIAAPARKSPVPHLNFAPLQNALEFLETRADAYATAARDRSPKSTEDLDRLLYQAERKLTREAGLPRRPWFRHHIYAPGFYTGYGVKTLPGIREAIEERKWEEAETYIQITADVLLDYAKHIDDATEQFRQ